MYFFGCSCGSKVLFDDLGGSWPRHDCLQSWEQRLTRRTTTDGGVAVEVADRVDAIRPGDDSDHWDIETIEVRTVDWTAPIEAMLPPPRQTATVCGIVRELLPTRDPHADLELEPGTFGARSFAPVTEGPAAQITVHQPSPEDGGLVESYTTYVLAPLIDGISKGNTVVAELTAVTGLDGRSVWWCDDLFPL